MKRASPLRRSGSLKRTRLAPVSRKQRQRQRAWPAVKALIHMRDEWRCLRCGWCDPSGRTLNAHHKRLRSRSTVNADEPENLVTLCAGPGTPDCHGTVHRNVAAATRDGWITPSWEDVA